MEELERAEEDEDEVRPGRRRNCFLDDEAGVSKRGREDDWSLLTVHLISCTLDPAHITRSRSLNLFQMHPLP